MLKSDGITKLQSQMYTDVSGIIDEIPFWLGGTFKLHRVGWYFQVEFYAEDGSFSHIVANGVDEYVFMVWDEIKEDYEVNNQLSFIRN